MMGVQSAAGPILAAAWCLVRCPEAFAREDTRAGEPQGLDVSLDMEVVFLEEL